jgi:hypothetical protein
MTTVSISRRTFPWRLLCRDSVRLRTSLRAIALRFVCEQHSMHSLLTPARSGSRFTRRYPAGANENWWTGEDSNLRSPQGAADLQSAGFSHSPTRPRNFIREANFLFVKLLFEKLSAPQAKTQNGLVSKDTSPSILLPRIRSASFPRELTGGAGGGN